MVYNGELGDIAKLQDKIIQTTNNIYVPQEHLLTILNHFYDRLTFCVQVKEEKLKLLLLLGCPGRIRSLLFFFKLS